MSKVDIQFSTDKISSSNTSEKSKSTKSSKILGNFLRIQRVKEVVKRHAEGEALQPLGKV